MGNNGKKIGNVIRYKLCEKINNTNPQTMHGATQDYQNSK